jgi:hypothetical protein
MMIRGDGFMAIKLNIEDCNGLVAILDRLGASKTSPREYLNHLQILICKSYGLLEYYDWTSEKDGMGFALKTYTFADNVLFSWHIENEVTALHIDKFAKFLIHFTHEALKIGEPYQGAIAVGDFTRCKELNAVLGTAIKDCSKHYEKYDWIGIVLTLDSGNKWEDSISTGNHPFLPDLTFMKYRVPVRCGGEEELFALGWPYFYQTYDRSKMRAGKLWDSSECFMKYLKPLWDEAPTEAMSKYENTRAFYDYYYSNISPDSVVKFFEAQKSS